MATHIWLLLLLTPLSQTADPNIPNHAALNRNRADDNEKDTRGTSLSFSSSSSLFGPGVERKTGHDDGHFGDGVMADDNGGPLFEGRAEREAEPRTADRSSAVPTLMLDSRRGDVPIGADDIVGIGNYLRSCDNCLVAWRGSRCPLDDQAMELKKWILELQNILSYGCPMGGQCGVSDTRCCYRQDSTLEQAVMDTANRARQMYHVFQDNCLNCPSDGGWGEWCEWSACSMTCDAGIRTRSRKCNHPTPRGNGRRCPGPPTETRACRGPSCTRCVDPVWSNWCNWGECSATCGSGYQERRRTCVILTPLCRRPCPGPAVDRRECMGSSLGPCCVDGNWGTWGRWGQCSVTCKEGVRERRRQCNNPRPNPCGRNCPGESGQSEICQNDDCVCVPRHGNWAEWGTWSTCENGQRFRNRPCSNPPANECGEKCPGSRIEKENCCEWGIWTPWSQCDSTCGRGSRVRNRRCVARDRIPAGVCQGQCPGLSVDRLPCPGLPSCDDADWTSWSSWCTCDCRGTRSRRRRCRTRQSGTHVDISLCKDGDAREEERCDVRHICPACLREGDCAGRDDGEYPSCISCRHYVRCTNGQMQVFECTKEGTEWDQFIRKCTSSPSLTCSLVDCVNVCTGRDSKSLPSCDGCQYYLRCGAMDLAQALPCPAGQEFNAHLGECVDAPSPTCVVLPALPLPNDEPHRLGDIRDAPADTYFLTDNLTKAKRKQLYRQLKAQVHIATKPNTTTDDDDDDDEEEFLTREEEEDEKEEKKKEKEGAGKTVTEKEGEGEEEKEREGEREKISKDGGKSEKNRTVKPNPNKRPRDHDKDRKHKNSLHGKYQTRHHQHRSNSHETNTAHRLQHCRKDCSDAEAGYYQSCWGCRYYLLCTIHGRARHLKCPGRRVWDDVAKKCRHHSRSCRSFGGGVGVRP